MPIPKHIFIKKSEHISERVVVSVEGESLVVRERKSPKPIL